MEKLNGWAPLVFYIAAVIIVFGVAIIIQVATPDAPPEPGILLPCPTEDSDNCWWDATEGNGEGLSFVVIDGKVTYLAPKGR